MLIEEFMTWSKKRDAKDDFMTFVKEKYKSSEITPLVTSILKEMFHMAEVMGCVIEKTNILNKAVPKHISKKGVRR